MQDNELVERVARAIFDAPDTQSGDYVGTVIWNSERIFCDGLGNAEDQAWRGCRQTCIDAARAIIPIVQAATLDLVESHLSTCAYDPAPYTALKYRIATAIRNHEPTDAG